jgi:outer membrane murein-binding lipoprotein Lpp
MIKPNRIYVVSVLAVLLLAGGITTYFWQHSKAQNANTKVSGLTKQITYLNKQVSDLTGTVSNDSAQLKQKSTTPTYHIGDTQCINGLCITLNNFQRDPPGNSPDSDQPGTMLVSVQLTVTNKGSYPATFDSEKDIAYEGLFSGSLLYTSDNLFWTPFTGGVGGGTFVNQMQDYPKVDQTETGTLVWEIPNTETVDSYLYGNLTWIL